MKRYVTVAAGLLMGAALAFAGGSKDKGKAAAAPEKEPSHEELVAAAQKEGSLTIYTHSSRTAKAAAIFQEKYGIKVDVTQLKDSEMIEKVSKEAAADLDAADIIFCQDGSRVYPELILTGYVQKYIPASAKGHIIDSMYEDPLVWEIMPKLFLYNNEKEPLQVTNIWQFTEPEFKGRLQFKDAFSEGVNMNFFTMITRDDWAKKIAAAYKELYGKELTLTTKNAGYEWIKALFKNGVVLGKSDTTVAENVGAKDQTKQLYALITSNKMRTAKAKNLALQIAYEMKPFAGFMYPAYTFITKNAKSPNAAKLYMEFSMTAEGWEPFNTMGDYSAVDTIKNNKEDKYTLEDWAKIVVFEDPVWCSEARSDVEEFMSSLM